MNFVLWMVAGAVVGWIAYTYLNMSEGRGKAVSLFIGAVGGVLGGKEVAPMFVAATEVPGAFSGPTLLVAAIVAALLLFIGNLVYNRWNV